MTRFALADFIDASVERTRYSEGRRERSARSVGALRRLLGAAVIATAAISFDLGLLLRSSARAEIPAPVAVAAANAARQPAASGPLAALFGARQWLNTEPLRPEDLRGKVVLVNVWTYTCIYSLRPLPYIRAWAEKYRDRGLVVVGVHAPEFSFEKLPANVRLQTAANGVGWPVAIDSDYRIWRALDNNAWPTLYFIDANGRVRDRLVGEGGYAEAERLIQQLLSERGGAPVGMDLVRVRGEGLQAAPDIANVRSPETYVGYEHGSNFASPGGARLDAARLYRAPATLPLNRWALTGNWTIGREAATLTGPSGKLAYRFHARDLHLVLATGGQPARFRVTIDGAPPGADHGFDTDAEGWGTAREDRLYQLVRQAGAVGERTFEIEFLDPGVRAVVFTFG